MSEDDLMIREVVAGASGRRGVWSTFLNQTQAATVAEIGVFKGDFAAAMLAGCPSLERYYMIDPWRHLEGWNKPANRSDEVFEGFLAEAMSKTEQYDHKRVVLRGRTTEVIDQISDAELDFAYIDGDHTLRGITVDLIRVLPKVRVGGWIAGDDFCRSIWQHKRQYEPTLVFPYAVYVAEAMSARIYALPYNQFLLRKTQGGEHAFVDLTGRYGPLGLQHHLADRSAQRTDRRDEVGAAAVSQRSGPSAVEPQPGGRTGRMERLTDRIRKVASR